MQADCVKEQLEQARRAVQALMEFAGADASAPLWAGDEGLLLSLLFQGVIKHDPFTG